MESLKNSNSIMILSWLTRRLQTTPSNSSQPIPRNGTSIACGTELRTMLAWLAIPPGSLSQPRTTVSFDSCTGTASSSGNAGDLNRDSFGVLLLLFFAHILDVSFCVWQLVNELSQGNTVECRGERESVENEEGPDGGLSGSNTLCTSSIVTEKETTRRKGGKKEPLLGGAHTK